jgi:hypothetical protein
VARVEDYRTYAKQYFALAREADSEELRRASLKMASYWMEAAMRTECLGDSLSPPNEHAANQRAPRVVQVPGHPADHDRVTQINSGGA